MPDACTLPTVEQPLRVGEFDALFAERLLRVEHHGPHEVSLVLRGGTGVAERVADLAARETSCCSFFSFEVEPDADEVVLRVKVPQAYAGVLAALADRAESR